jgi:hypothetical protein
MAVKPILFSAPMVRALIAGEKTQTRRVLGGAPHNLSAGQVFADRLGEQWRWSRPGGGGAPFKTPFAPGDLLWVKEDWKVRDAYDDLKPSEMSGEEAVHFLADGAIAGDWGRLDGPWGRRRWSQHMCRWASRLTLRVTEVRVQRLQVISGEDCVAEGLSPRMGPPMGVYDDMRARSEEAARRWAIGMRAQFRDLWDNLNAARGFGWDVNPWVVATSFKVTEGNVDGIAEAGGADG